jgi:hypothetical protein
VKENVYQVFILDRVRRVITNESREPSLDRGQAVSTETKTNFQIRENEFIPAPTDKTRMTANPLHARKKKTEFSSATILSRSCGINYSRPPKAE